MAVRMLFKQHKGEGSTYFAISARTDGSMSSSDLHKK
jgi:hypothetical protein